MYFIKLLFCFQILRSVPGTISNPFSWGKFEDFFLHFYPSNPIVVELFLSNMGGGIPFDFNETMFFEFPLLGLKNAVKDIMVSHTSILMYFIFNSLIFVCIFQANLHGFVLCVLWFSSHSQLETLALQEVRGVHICQ